MTCLHSELSNGLVLAVIQVHVAFMVDEEVTLLKLVDVTDAAPLLTNERRCLQQQELRFRPTGGHVRITVTQLCPRMNRICHGFAWLRPNGVVLPHFLWAWGVQPMCDKCPQPRYLKSRSYAV